ncbi:MAG: ribonuclease HII [Alphaproteobacteria bacterium]|nr:ribonuclease HII [Alphaproteobacteria bacterium]
MKTFPDFSLEIESGFHMVAGCDEAGRGPLCGPVVAAAVVFENRSIVLNQQIKIADSKQMSHSQRAAAYDWITENTIWAVGQCSPAEIDELNILKASMLAMKRAIDALSCIPEFVLVDGNRMPDGIVGQPVVKGDSKSLSIAAASIIAKEHRDKIMRALSMEFPQYGWDKNAGYPTAAHLQAIEKYGINQHYRKSYEPVKKIIKDSL